MSVHASILLHDDVHRASCNISVMAACAHVVHQWCIILHYKHRHV